MGSDAQVVDIVPVVAPMSPRAFAAFEYAMRDSSTHPTGAEADAYTLTSGAIVPEWGHAIGPAGEGWAILDFTVRGVCLAGSFTLHRAMVAMDCYPPEALLYETFRAATAQTRAMMRKAVT